MQFETPVPRTAPRDRESLLTELAERLARSENLDQRFENVVSWVESALPTRAAFVADAEGLAMVQSDAGEGYLVAAGEIGAVLGNLSSLLPEVEEGGTTLRLKDRGTLELVWCRTELGRFTVGLLLDDPLAAQSVQMVRAGLKLAATQLKSGSKA